ncbi:hypothetical protein M3Y98_01072900 [Aphelenchoides besseyi]|nr:hypothetical protein M3Y98_01072900 [Aphelenchoides besseyi]KAI6209603.1 hypothetical protein M3Y96_00238300 [Aphelenchoides besseyi]
MDQLNTSDIADRSNGGERKGSLIANLIVRNVYKKAFADPPAECIRYKCELDTELPSGLNQNEMQERFDTISEILKKDPAKGNDFDQYQMPRRREISDLPMVQEGDRAQRVAIWTALHANEEKFFYRPRGLSNPLKQMNLITDNMEYAKENTIGGEKRIDKEDEVQSPKTGGHRWFSKFYV